MQTALLLLVAAVLLLACSSSPLNGNEVAVYADNDDLAGNEVSFETSGNNQGGEEGDDDSSHLSEQEKNRKMVEAGTKLALVIGSLISIAGGPAAAVSIGKPILSTILHY